MLILVLDDVGFADLGCYGSRISTPHIDRLATNGLRFTSFHTTALCSPSRACFLTGRNHHAVGMGYVPEAPTPHVGYTGRLPRSAAMLPRHLRDAGYSTFAVGKWHLTPADEVGAAGPFHRWPLGIGFERFYGFLRGVTNQWTPDLVLDNGLVDPPRSPRAGYHLTEDLTDQAIRFVTQHRQAAPDRPFFLYFATGAMHDPHLVAPEWAQPYRGRFSDGWDALRETTFDRQRQLGVVPEDATLTGRPPWIAAWQSLTDAERQVFGRQMEVYAGFLSHTDAQIGRLLAFLESADLLRDTLVVLMSDNGASGDAGPHGVLAPDAHDVGTMLARLDDFGGHRAQNHYSWGWAWAGNTPFKLWKHYAWLGGVRVPLIAHWPARIPSDQRGAVRRQFCHAIDVMPTVLDAAGVAPAHQIDGVRQQDIHGASLLPVLDASGAPAPRTTQYFEVEGSRAIYSNGWKATTDHVTLGRGMVTGSLDFDADTWSLYHLDSDFSEARDLAGRHPALLARLIRLWHAQARRHGVLPQDDRTFTERLESDRAPARPSRFVYWPNSGPIVTPSLAGGFRMTAELTTASGSVPETSGVICAQGDWNGGWACYIHQGMPTATFRSGSTLVHLTASQRLDAGDHTITVELTPCEDRWRLAASTDTHEFGRADFSMSQSFIHWLSVYAKLLVGRDRGFPVSPHYDPPFAFSGTIRQVVFTIPSP